MGISDDERLQAPQKYRICTVGPLNLMFKEMEPAAIQVPITVPLPRFACYTR